MTQLYSRSTLKRLVKAHQPKSQLSKNADVLVTHHTLLSSLCNPPPDAFLTRLNQLVLGTPILFLGTRPTPQLYLDYVLFLNRLAAEARIAALKNNDKTVESRHINAVLEVCYQRAAGLMVVTSWMFSKLGYQTFSILITAHLSGCAPTVQSLKSLGDHDAIYSNLYTKPELT